MTRPGIEPRSPGPLANTLTAGPMSRKHIIHIHLHIHAEHNDTMKTTNDTVLRKIYLSLYLKGLCVRESWRPNRTATYWPPLLWPSALCLSRSPGLFNWRPGAQLSAGCWLLPLPLLSPNSLVSELTDFLSSPSYIIVQRPPSCGRHKLHQLNPSTVKVIISWSTGCTCYLQKCISYFDSPAWS